MPAKFFLSIKYFALIFLISPVCFSDKSLGISFIPDEIDIPTQLKKRNPVEIKAVFSSLEKQNKQKTANLWKLKYHSALMLKKKDKDFFCKTMKELGSISAFPLKDLALIESYELCPYSELKFKPESFPEWLRTALAEAFYKRKNLFDDPDQTLQAIIYLSYNSPYKELRVSYLKHALVLAEEPKKDYELEKLKQQLYKEAPRLKPNPEPKDYLSIAEDLKDNRQFKKAIDFYIKVLNFPKASFDDKYNSFKGLDHIYRIQRSHKKKTTNSQQWSEWLLKENTEQSLKKYYSRRLELARQKWNLNQNQEAIRLITEMLKEKKSQFIKAEALYLRALIYIQEKEVKLSLQDWDQALKILRKKKNPKLREKILWKKAWFLRSQKEHFKALKNFEKLEKISKNPYLLYRVLFWKGKILKELGQNTLSNRNWRSLIQKDSFGYYGLLARKMLNKQPEFQKKAKKDYPEPLLRSNKAEDTIHWLALFNYHDLLSLFLGTKKSKFLNQKIKTEKDWIKMLWLWIKAKKYLEVFQSLEQMDDNMRANFLKKHTYLFFPLDFNESVEKASKRWDVSKALIFSIIRQESAFNSKARSPADAFGLMQLIPSTARQTARKFKISYRSFRDLYKPQKNIFLGTAHIRSLLKIYDNSFLFSVSAYNAGGVPLNKWVENLEDKKNFNSLEFIENIPYEETRTYVRLLIRNYVFYHNQLNDNESWFPDWLIQ